jgi:hypothetical protein
MENKGGLVIEKDCSVRPFRSRLQPYASPNQIYIIGIELNEFISPYTCLGQQSDHSSISYIQDLANQLGHILDRYELSDLAVIVILVPAEISFPYGVNGVFINVLLILQEIIKA